MGTIRRVSQSAPTNPGGTGAGRSPASTRESSLVSHATHASSFHSVKRVEATAPEQRPPGGRQHNGDETRVAVVDARSYRNARSDRSTAARMESSGCFRHQVLVKRA